MLRKLCALLALFSGIALAQISPQIQGAGAPGNPCSNGGQQYVDTTNHVIYQCPSNGSNWVKLGLGNQTGGVKFTQVTVAQLPSAGAGAWSAYVVTDGNSATDCSTGSGATAVVCWSNGTSWAALGGSSGSGTVTNTSGNLTANQLVIGNGTVDIKTLGSLGTTTTVLHGNAGGAPTFGAVSLTADVSGVLPAGSGGVANLTTGLGFFFGGYVSKPPGGSSLAVLTASANQVRAFEFVLPYAITVGHCAWFTGASAGDTVDFGIYSSDGTTKLLDCGATVSAGSSAAQQISTSSTPLTPGVYYFAWTQTGTPTTTFQIQGDTSGNVTAILNINSQKRFVTAGNTATAGALPSSLGTLTAAFSGNMPVVVFEQ